MNNKDRTHFVYFSPFPIPISFTISIMQTEKSPGIWCAWDSNLGPPDGRRRRNHGTLAAPLIKNELPMFVCLFASFCITLTVLSSFRRSTRAPRSCPSRLATTRRGPYSTEGRRTLPRMRIWQFRLVVLYSFSAVNKAGVLKKAQKVYNLY